MRLFICVIFVVSLPIFGQVAVHGKLIHTMAGDPIQDGVVLIRDGKIDAIGKARSIQIPEGYQILEAEVVTPGLIDTHSVVGLAGILNYEHDQEQIEKSSPMQPELRAIDAYNTRDPLVAWIRNLGVTTIHTGHAPAALISGQTMIVKTAGNTVEDAVINPFAMIAATIGEGAIRSDSPGTRSKIVAMLRQEFLRVQNLLKSREKNPEQTTLSLRDEAIAGILQGKTPLLVTAHKHQDILSALRIAKEFNLSLVLDGVTEGYLVTEDIKAAKVPVIVHPTMFRGWGETENISMTTPAKLKKAGISITIQSGYESYVPKTRVVLFEAAIAVRYGLPYQDALAALTIEAAKLLKIEDRVGSLEIGKDADVALYSGDPFEYTTHCLGTIINGEVVYQKKEN